MIQVQTLDFSEGTQAELLALSEAIASAVDEEERAALIERHDELVKQAQLKPC